MEGAAVIAYVSLKSYWRRENYHRLINTKHPPLQTSQSQFQKPKIGNKRPFRIRRIKLQLGRFRIRFDTVRKLFLKMRDAYVNAMLGVGISSSGYGGFVGGSDGAKEYDEKMVVEIYKRIVLAQKQVHGRSVSAREIGSDVTPACLFR